MAHSCSAVGYRDYCDKIQTESLLHLHPVDCVAVVHAGLG